MKEKDSIAFHLTITTGADEGKTFRVEPGECVLGRAPTCGIVLTDESVAWEHIMLRSEGGKLLLQNLSAAGTRVKGSMVTGELRIASSEEIELSETCRVVVNPKVGGGSGSPRVRLGSAISLVAVLVVAAVAYYKLQPQAKPVPRFTHAHYESAYQSLEARLSEWADDGGPGHEESLTIFRNAWRFERAFNSKAASAEWNHLRSLLLTVRRPGEDRTIAQTRDDDAKKALGVVSGWDPVTSVSTEPYYDSDEAYADALARFVRRRSEITHMQVEERR